MRPIPVTLISILLLVLAIASFWATVWVNVSALPGRFVQPAWQYAFMAALALGTSIGLWRMKLWVFYYYAIGWLLLASIYYLQYRSFNAKSLIGLLLMAALYAFYKKRFSPISSNPNNDFAKLDQGIWQNTKKRHLPLRKGLVSLSLIFGLLVAISARDVFSNFSGNYLGNGWASEFVSWLCTPGFLISLLVTGDSNILSYNTIYITSFLFWFIATYLVLDRVISRT